MNKIIYVISPIYRCIVFAVLFSSMDYCNSRGVPKTDQNITTVTIRSEDNSKLHEKKEQGILIPLFKRNGLTKKFQSFLQEFSEKILEGLKKSRDINPVEIQSMFIAQVPEGKEINSLFICSNKPNAYFKKYNKHILQKLIQEAIKTSLTEIQGEKDKLQEEQTKLQKEQAKLKEEYDLEEWLQINAHKIAILKEGIQDLKMIEQFLSNVNTDGDIDTLELSIQSYDKFDLTEKFDLTKKRVYFLVTKEEEKESIYDDKLHAEVFLARLAEVISDNQTKFFAYIRGKKIPCITCTNILHKIKDENKQIIFDISDLPGILYEKPHTYATENQILDNLDFYDLPTPYKSIFAKVTLPRFKENVEKNKNKFMEELRNKIPPKNRQKCYAVIVYQESTGDFTLAEFFLEAKAKNGMDREELINLLLLLASEIKTIDDESSLNKSLNKNENDNIKVRLQVQPSAIFSFKCNDIIKEYKHTYISYKDVSRILEPLSPGLGVGDVSIALCDFYAASEFMEQGLVQAS